VIARQRCLDKPGPLVSEHLDLAGLDGVEGLLGTDSGLILGASIPAAMSVSMKLA